MNSKKYSIQTQNTDRAQSTWTTTQRKQALSQSDDSESQCSYSTATSATAAESQSHFTMIQDFLQTRTVPPPPRHLVKGYQPAWKCTCKRCEDSRCYGAKWPGIIQFYRQEHDGQSPWDVVPTENNNNKPNAILCAKCYKEQSPKEEDFERENCHSTACLSMFTQTLNLQSNSPNQFSNFPCASLNKTVLDQYKNHQLYILYIPSTRNFFQVHMTTLPIEMESNCTTCCLTQRLQNKLLFNKLPLHCT